MWRGLCHIVGWERREKGATPEAHPSPQGSHPLLSVLPQTKSDVRAPSVCTCSFLSGLCLTGKYRPACFLPLSYSRKNLMRRFLSFNLELSLDSCHTWCLLSMTWLMYRGFPSYLLPSSDITGSTCQCQSYICLFSCVRSPSSVFWTGFLRNSFPGCQLSLLFSLQHAWLLCFAEDAPLRLQRCFQEEVSSWGMGLIFLPKSYREEATAC